jgi:hypothetical protein
VVFFSPPTPRNWPLLLYDTSREILAKRPFDDAALTVLTGIGLLESERPRFAANEMPMNVYGHSLLRLGPGLPELVYAVRNGITPPALVRACTSLAITIGDFATARDCSIRGLDLGQDSTWHHLRLAAIASWARDTTPGVAHFLAASEASHHPGDREEVGWHLETAFHDRKYCLPCWINGVFTVGPEPRAGMLRLSYKTPRFTTAERNEFRNLPADSVVPWIMTKLDQSNRDSARTGVTELGRGYALLKRKEHGVWEEGSELARRLFVHFRLTSYGRGTFRPCLHFVPPFDPPCTPRFIEGPEHVPAAVAAHALWTPSGIPFALVSWALLGADLARGPEPVPTIELTWRAWDVSTGTVWDSTVATRSPRDNGASRGWMMGAIAAPAGSFRTVGMTVTQGAARRGGAFYDSHIPLDTGAVALSDPVLGQSGTGPIYMLGSDSVRLAPLATHSGGSPVELFFQTRSREYAGEGTAKLRLLGLDEATGRLDRELLVFALPIDVELGVQSHRRELLLPDMKNGAYRLEIALALPTGLHVVPRATVFGVKQ